MIPKTTAPYALHEQYRFQCIKFGDVFRLVSFLFQPYALIFYFNLSPLSFFDRLTVPLPYSSLEPADRHLGCIGGPRKDYFFRSIASLRRFQGAPACLCEKSGFLYLFPYPPTAWYTFTLRILSY